MNKFILGIVLLLVTGCTTVRPGYVGIKVNMYGTQKGVQDLPVQTGRVWYNPWTEDIHIFPTFMQTATWSKEDETDITFNSSEGATANADVSLTYSLEPSKVPHIFVEFRQDIDVITQTYLRSRVRDAFSRHAAEMKIVDIFGLGKQTLIDKVKEDLNKDLKAKGFNIDMISIIGSLRVDQQVAQSINATIQATQRAIEAENKIKQTMAESEQAIAKARGVSEAIRMEAQAKAEANKTLTESLSPELLTYEALQKWNGTMPMVVGDANSVPFIQIPQAVKK